ncbi:MAG: helix-turn-helix domain-containing protein [Treponema sp.]|nr:helix-turn-helix domain-containing protein [Treponema sp.]
MDNFNNTGFNPPNKVLKLILSRFGISQSELAIRTGVSPKHISKVLNGEAGITVSFAQKLEYALGMYDKSYDWDYFINLQKEYDKKQTLLQDTTNIITSELEIANKLDILINYCPEDFSLTCAANTKNLLTTMTTSNPSNESTPEESTEAQDCLDSSKQNADILKILKLRKLLHVSKLTDIPKLFAITTPTHNNETDIIKQNDYSIYYLFAWTQLCCNLYLKKAFSEQPQQVSSLTQKEQKHKLLNLIPHLNALFQFNNVDTPDFIYKLQEIFASCGIHFFVVPRFPQLNVSGFIKIINSSTDYFQTLLCITEIPANNSISEGNQHESFWYAIFHAIGHIVNGDVKKEYLEHSAYIYPKNIYQNYSDNSKVNMKNEETAGLMNMYKDLEIERKADSFARRKMKLNKETGGA